MIHSSRPLLRRVYIGAAGSAVVVLVAALLVATHAFGESTAGQWVQVATGSYRGDTWTLSASRGPDGLCMMVDGPAFQAPPGQCGFNAKPPDGSFWDDGLGPRTSTVSFGPLPRSATQIRLFTGEVIATYPLTTGLPTGRYWIAFTPADAPAAQAVDQPEPLDSAGHPVSFKDF